MLFGNEATTGAFYRLIHRTAEPAAAHLKALPLRSSSVADGLITAEEFETVSSHVMEERARVVSLLPVELACAAVRTFGCSPTSVAVLRAVGGDVPSDWSTSTSEDEEEGGEGEDGEGGGEGGEGEGGEGEGEGEGGEGEGEGEGEGGEGEGGEAAALALRLLRAALHAAASLGAPLLLQPEP